MILKEEAKEQFKQKIIEEIKERKLQEEREKEVRKKAAEERRALVLERIRKQKEAEENYRLEVQRKAEELARREQFRLDSDRTNMGIEDDLAKEIEAYLMEKLELSKWHEAEMLKLREWERKQKELDEKNIEAREARLKELKSKRDKVEEYRSSLQRNITQELSTKDNSIKQLQEKAQALAKQSRIQNKAVFVSKKGSKPIPKPKLKFVVSAAPVDSISSNEISSSFQSTEESNLPSLFDSELEGFQKFVSVMTAEKLIVEHRKMLTSFRSFNIQASVLNETKNEENVSQDSEEKNRILAREQAIITRLEELKVDKSVSFREAPLEVNCSIEQPVQRILSEIISPVSRADLGSVTQSSTVSIGNPPVVEVSTSLSLDSSLINSIVESPLPSPPCSSSLNGILRQAEAIPGWNEALETTMATAAHFAAFHGYSELLSFFSNIFDCFVMDYKGRTPLFYAAMNNQVECAAVLVSVDPQWLCVGDFQGDTPLHAAAISGSADVLSFFLSCEISPNICNNDGLTPAHLARSVEILQILAHHQAILYCMDNQSRMPLHAACSDGMKDRAEFLIQYTPSDFLFWRDNAGNTALHEACEHGHADIILMLCKANQFVDSLNLCNNKELTPAHLVTNVDCLQILYKYGANFWLQDAKGRVPLFYYSFRGCTECVSFLLSIELQRDSMSRTSKFLPKFSVRDQNGDTCTHAACFNGHSSCVFLLLFCIRFVPNNKGLNPIAVARMCGNIELANSIAILTSGNYESNFGCSFDDYVIILQQYKTRWSKLFDSSSLSVYYFDRHDNHSQWDRPASFDISKSEEENEDSARHRLITFYQTNNPSKLSDINDILFTFKNRYDELFDSLKAKYNVQ